MGIQDHFNRFADTTEKGVSHASFFVGCVIVVAVWALSGPVFGFNETWQLIINTGTTIVTFLLVALLQNTQARFEDSVNARLTAILEHLNIQDPCNDEGQKPDESADH